MSETGPFFWLKCYLIESKSGFFKKLFLKSSTSSTRVQQEEQQVNNKHHTINYWSITSPIKVQLWQKNENLFVSVYNYILKYLSNYKNDV